MKHFAALLVSFLTLISLSSAQHVRFVEGETQRDGVLQVSVVELRNTENVKVTLYGAVHIADKEFFKTAQKDLSKFDVVLYEGVKQGNNPNKETKALNSVQVFMADVLGFQFQKEGIDYTPTNFVHADIDMDTLEAKLDGQPLDPLSQLVSPEMMKSIKPFLGVISSFVKAYMAENPELQNDFKLQMARSLSQGNIEAKLPPQMKKAIIDDRNLIVLDALDVHLTDNPTKKNVAVFYGAGHSTDFIRRLEANGFTVHETTWKTAWVIGNGLD